MKKKHLKILSFSIPILVLLAVAANSESIFALFASPSEENLQDAQNSAQAIPEKQKNMESQDKAETHNVSHNLTVYHDELKNIEKMLNDPTAPPDPTKAAPQTDRSRSRQGRNGSYLNPAAQVILITNKTRIASIDGVIVKVGDEFQGGTVTAIEKDRVIVTLDGEKWTIYLEGKGYAPKEVSPKAIFEIHEE